MAGDGKVKDLVRENKIEACKTYVEQTKQLLTLASAFLIIPAGALTVLTSKGSGAVSSAVKSLFVASELCFMASTLFGYIVLGSITGSQDKGDFDVYTTGTRVLSLMQFGSFLAGLGLFVWLLYRGIPTT